jgi:hypothetical protein
MVILSTSTNAEDVRQAYDLHANTTALLPP